jgi:CAAX prenyl protease-like protein
MINRRKLLAYALPMALFLALLSFNGALKSLSQSFWLGSAEYWIYPLQTILCGLVLVWFWRDYQMGRPARPGLGLFVGIAVFILWIAPQAFLGFPPRLEGFNPGTFAAHPVPYWATVALRFLRLVVIVPLVEEIFWRGFLLRFLIDDDFERVPFGAFSWLSFSVVALVFALSHSTPDWPAALVTGMLYNLVAYRTKSLSTCVLTHATTNLLLGLWIMKTGQWGFW